MLFELSKPVIISPEIFNEIWPYVDSVYSKLQQELLHTVRVQKYECRLRKSRKSSTARVADGKVIRPGHETGPWSRDSMLVGSRHLDT